MPKAVGIDLGTTNTVVAEMQRGRTEPVTIQTRDYKPITRSVAAYKNGTWIVGEDAEEMGQFAPLCVIGSTKRFIGLSYGDKRIERDISLLNRNASQPRVVAAPDGESGVRFRFYPEAGPSLELSPVEVATLILKQVKEDTEAATGTTVTHAVITAPAYFDAARIEATRHAGEAAGLRVQRIISEPLAAALAYGMRLDASTAETVLVFDLGGGTFDVTVCTVGQNDCVELAKDGDNHLGGDDLDTRLEELVLKRLREASGVDFGAPDGAGDTVHQTLRYHLRRHCRGAKERLSNVDEVTILDTAWRSHPKAGLPGTGPVKITRAEFEMAIGDLVDRAMRLTQQALDKAGCTPAHITRVLLVGGSTYVPIVRERVRALFGAEKVRIEMNPMEAVAQGAAVLAATLPNLVLCPQCRTDQAADARTCPHCGAALGLLTASPSPTRDGPRLQIVSTIARTISVKTDQGNLVPLFGSGAQYSPTEGTPLAKKRETFRFATSGKRELLVEFYEGEGSRADDPRCAFYAEFTVGGLPADTRQGEEVILEATLNGDGTVGGIMTYRGRSYPYTASPSTWRIELVDRIDEARVLLPNVTDAAARAALQQAVDRADAAIEHASDSRGGRAARDALSRAIAEVVQPEFQSTSQEMQKLSLSLAIAGAMFEYGDDWVKLLPVVSAPGLRDTLLGESQLLNALRPVVVEGRQIVASNQAAYAERVADRIDSIVHASALLYPLVFARIISEYSEDGGPNRGPGRLLAQPEWESIRRLRSESAQNRQVATTGGKQQQCADDISALLDQMRVTIVSNPALFSAQFDRVLELMDQFNASEG